MKLNKLLLLFLPFSLYSYEVNFDKTFSKDLKVEILSNKLNIKLESSSEKEISDILNSFEQKIRKYKKIDKKFFSLTIKPTYKYRANETPKLLSYIGSLKYNIFSDSAKEFNEFISKMIKIKKHRNVSLLVSDLSWVVKELTKEKEKDKLRIEAIKWIQSYSKELSNELNSVCLVKSIKINSLKKIKTLVNLDTSEKYKKVIGLNDNHINISINAFYILECE